MYGKPKHIHGKSTESLVNNPVLTFHLELTDQIDPSLSSVALLHTALKFSLIVCPSFHFITFLLIQQMAEDMEPW